MDEASTTSQEDSMSSYSLRDSAVAMRQVVLNQHFMEAKRSQVFQVSAQPNIYTTSLNIPSPLSYRKLSGILELGSPTNSTTKGANETATAQAPSSPCPSHNSVHRPSHLLQKNSKLPSDFPSSRLRYMTTLNEPPEDVEAETRKVADGYSASNSEAEEELGQPCRSPLTSPRRENAETKRGSPDCGEHVKKVEFTKQPSKNQFLTDPSDTRRNTPRLSGNDTTVNRSGSFSIPARTTYVTQLRPSLRTPSPASFARRRPDLSPRSLVSTASMLSLDCRPSRIPRPIQRSARTAAPNVSPERPVLPYEIRYSVFNVFTIVMTTGSDERADPFNPLSGAIVAKESVVEGHCKGEVLIKRSYIHPTVRKIETYDPVRISTKLSEIISAVVSIEKPKVMHTLANKAKLVPGERIDKHIIVLTEFRDAVRVYEPVVPTVKPAVTNLGNIDRVTSTQPPADDRAIGTETLTQKIISMIPPVVLANARIKKQKRSKSVQSKVLHSVKPSVRHAIQSSVQSVFQSSVYPAVHSSLPTMVHHTVSRPTAAKSLAQPAPAESLVQSVVEPTVRPGRKTSSLVSEIVEVSFTDLDKKAFRPRHLTSSPSPKNKTRTSGKESGRSGRKSTRAKSPTDASREGLLTTASRSALKAIVRAILANTGVELPDEHTSSRKDKASKDAGVHNHSSHAKTSLSALAPSSPTSQRKNWSLDEANPPTGKTPAMQFRAQSSPGGEDFLGGRYPLGSSVTQVFCKHRKDHHHHHHHHESPDIENHLSWSKALYAKTLYFQNERKENQQRQTNARHTMSSLHGVLSSAANPNYGGRSVRYDEDTDFGRDHFRSIGLLPEERHSNNLSSSNSVAAKIDDAFANLEQSVSSFLLNQYRRSHPIPMTG